MTTLDILGTYALLGLGLLACMGFVVLILILISDWHRHPDIVHCTLCGYVDTSAKVIRHEKQDHPC